MALIGPHWIEPAFMNTAERTGCATQRKTSPPEYKTDGSYYNCSGRLTNLSPQSGVVA